MKKTWSKSQPRIEASRTARGAIYSPFINFITISGLPRHHYARGSEFSPAFVFLDFAAAQQTRLALTAKAPPAANATVSAAIDIIIFIISSDFRPLRARPRPSEAIGALQGTDRSSMLDRATQNRGETLHRLVGHHPVLAHRWPGHGMRGRSRATLPHRVPSGSARSLEPAVACHQA